MRKSSGSGLDIATNRISVLDQGAYTYLAASDRSIVQAVKHNVLVTVAEKGQPTRLAAAWADIGRPGPRGLAASKPRAP